MKLNIMEEMPKVFPLMAEWIACWYYIYWNKKRINLKYMILISFIEAFCLGELHRFLEYHPIEFWIPSMLAIVLCMFFMIYLCCDISIYTAGYFCVNALILSEFMSSFAWQMCYYFYIEKGIKSAVIEISTEVVIYIFLFFMLYTLDKLRKKKELKFNEFEASKKEFGMVLALGVITFAMGNLNYVFWVSPFMGSDTLDLFNIRTWITLCGFVILYAYHEQVNEIRVIREVYAVRSLLDKQYEQYKKSQESMEYMNQQYHDFKHILTVLRMENESEKRTEYLNEIENEIKRYEIKQNTGSPVLDTVLTSKMMKCQKGNITLTCVANGALLNKLHVFDICTIFGNALDNAIECEVQVPERDKRLIHLSVSTHNNFIIIRIENYFEGILEMKNGLPCTTKAEKEKHGYGIKSIQYSVRKYKGEITVNCIDNWYVLNIMIPN